MNYLIESSYKTGYYFDQNGSKIERYSYMILVKDETVLETLPDEITPGSWAYTAAGKKVWQMDFDREWIPAFDEDE